MTARDPLKFYPHNPTWPTIKDMMKRADRKPRLGLTQGGSSSKDPGCKPAATDGEMRAEIPIRGEY